MRFCSIRSPSKLHRYPVPPLPQPAPEAVQCENDQQHSDGLAHPFRGCGVHTDGVRRQQRVRCHDAQHGKEDEGQPSVMAGAYAKSAAAEQQAEYADDEIDCVERTCAFCDFMGADNHQTEPEH